MSDPPLKPRTFIATVARLLLIALALCAALLAVCALTGCAGAPAPSIAATGSEIAKADALVEAATPYTNSTGKPMLQAARTHLAAASEHNAKVAKASAAREAELLKLQGKWYVVWGKRIEKVLIGIAIYAALWLGLSIAAPFVSGPAGAIMATAATWMNPGEWMRAWRGRKWAARNQGDPP